MSWEIDCIDPEVLCQFYTKALCRHHKPPSQTKTCHLVLWNFVAPTYLLCGRFHRSNRKLAKTCNGQYFLFNGKHFWLCIQKLGKILLCMLSFPLLTIYKDQKIFKARNNFLFVLSSHACGIVYKMHIKTFSYLFLLY